MTHAPTILLALLLALLLSFARGEDCLSDPSDPACTSFTYPDANSTVDVDNLCTAMDNMPGCTVRTLCLQDSYANDEYCEAFSLLADVCEYDMPMMSGCASYVSLCSPEDSVVHQCEMHPSIPGLPTTMEANDAIKSLCAQHAMPGCEKCDLSSESLMDCDLLSVYSEICLSMPSMSDCAQWELMCDAIPDWPALCPSNQQAPIMKMYFHTGILDYILFKTWVPRTNGQYAGAVIGVLLLAFVFEAFQTFRAYMEFRWKRAESEVLSIESSSSSKSEEELWGPTPFRFWIDLMRAGLHVVEIIIGYSLMLIAMTFNVGLFLAIMAGFFLGSFVFGRFKAYKAKPSCCD